MNLLNFRAFLQYTPNAKLLGICKESLRNYQGQIFRTFPNLEMIELTDLIIKSMIVWEFSRDRFRRALFVQFTTNFVSHRWFCFRTFSFVKFICFLFFPCCLFKPLIWHAQIFWHLYDGMITVKQLLLVIYTIFAIYVYSSVVSYSVSTQLFWEFSLLQYNKCKYFFEDSWQPKLICIATEFCLRVKSKLFEAKHSKYFYGEQLFRQISNFTI